MQNWELISKLINLPAGAEVRVRFLKSNDEITYLEEDELNEIYSNIGDVELSSNIVYLSD